MELAVLADIHSNYIALERCMKYAVERGIEHFLFLGDYIGEFAYPERTMELLRQYDEKYDCVFIRGNKENYWLKYRACGEQGWYAYHHLKGADLNFFEGLPIAKKIQYGDLPTLLACHGLPEKVNEDMSRENGEAMRALENAEVSYILCGHTHIQGKLEHGGTAAINPGSVGVALKAKAQAQFVILHGETGRWREEFVSLDYDRGRVISELYESGLMKRAPYWCMITEGMLCGKMNENAGHMRVLLRAMDICRQRYGECNWPGIPEECWGEAVKYFL